DPDDTPGAHGHHDHRQLEHFLQIAAREDDRGPSRCGAEQDAVDRRPAADVHATGRLVHEQDLDVGAEQVPADQSLLLIASRQLAHRGLEPSGVDPGRLREPEALAALASGGDEAGARYLIQLCGQEILGDRSAEEQAILLAVVGDKADAMAPRLHRVTEAEWPSSELDASHGTWDQAGDRA